MKRAIHPLLLLLLFSVTLSGCQVIGDIFRAGMWVGLLVAFIVVLIIFAIVKAMR
jgi:uncharacterized membrane protein YcjF (UPF0283 family)